MLVDVDIRTLIDGMNLERMNELKLEIERSIVLRTRELDRDIQKIDIAMHNLIRDNKRADAIIMLRNKNPGLSIMRAKEIIDWYMAR